MAAVGKLEITNVFADDSTLKIAINNINPAVGVNPNIKTLIKNFNNEQGGTLSEKMKSKNGFNWVGIKRARFIITDKEYIF